jgi:hypothetical protein
MAPDPRPGCRSGLLTSPENKSCFYYHRNTLTEIAVQNRNTTANAGTSPALHWPPIAIPCSKEFGRKLQPVDLMTLQSTSVVKVS